MKRYIKPDIETIEMASILLLAGSDPEEEKSQIDEAMSKRHNFDFSEMEQSNSTWLKSNTFWDDEN